MAITLGLVEAVDSNGVYVSMPGSRGVLRGPYRTVDDSVAVGTSVLVVSTDDGEQIVVGVAGSASGPINVAEFGRDDAAVREAFAAALSTTPARVLYFPQGTYSITGSITVTQRVVLVGDGNDSILTFTNGGLIFDATAAPVYYTKVRGLMIQRAGTVAGPAVWLKGYGTNGMAAFVFDDVHMSSPAGWATETGYADAGDALLIEGAYLGTFASCRFTESKYGIRGIRDETEATGQNAMTFLGGWVAGNHYGWDFHTATSIAISGLTTEYNAAGGGKISGYSRGIYVSGCYFEANGGPDLEIDAYAGGPVTITSNFFNATDMDKTECVLLKRGRVNVSDNAFTGQLLSHGDAAIRVDEGDAPVLGVAMNNTTEPGDVPLIAYDSGGAAFNVTQLGQVTKAGATAFSPTLNEEAGISWVRKVTSVLNFPEIAANSEESLTVTVTGADVGDDVTVTAGILETGLIYHSCAVTSADTVTIRLRNVTGSPINPEARSFQVRVWR